MVVNVRLANNDAPLIRASHTPKEPRRSRAVRQFCEGLFVGLLVMAATVAIYWLVVTYAHHIPGLHSLYMKYWLAYT